MVVVDKLTKETHFIPVKTLMVHHTSPGFSRSRGRPTSGYSRSGDRPTHHTSRSSSRRACRSDNRPTVEDSRVVDRPTLQSTTSWMDSRSGRVLVEPT
jgi:hypothetical protein